MDVATVGQTYAIEEIDFRKMLEERLAAWQSEVSSNKTSVGEGSLSRSIQESMRKHVLRPNPVDLPTTIQAKTFWYTPTITLTKDIKNPEGSTIIPAGTRVNPLDYFSLMPSFAFFNSDDPKQLCWAKKLIKNYPPTIKLILIKGDIEAASRALKRVVYFDQFAWLSTKFHLQHVPALVTVSGKQLKITETLPC